MKPRLVSEFEALQQEISTHNPREARSSPQYHQEFESHHGKIDARAVNNNRIQPKQRSQLGRHLKAYQKLDLVRNFEKSYLPLPSFCYENQVSESTMRRAIKNKSELQEHAKEEEKGHTSSGLSREEEFLIQKLVEPPKYPLTLGYLNSKLSSAFGVGDKTNIIRQYLKTKLKYSYKKGGK